MEGVHHQEGTKVSEAEPTTESVAAEEAEEVDELTALRRELEEVKAQATEYLDGWQRARAEFANYRRRQELGREELHKLANATLVRRVLPTLDDFERAFSTLPPGLMGLTWIDGVALIHRKLEAALEAEGLTVIGVEPGQFFDPLVHEAVTRESHDTFDEGQVIAEVQRGYKLGELLLRPSLVRVSSGPAEQRVHEEGREQREGEVEAVDEEGEKERS